MPNYDFKCQECGGIQEVYREFGDSTEPVCCQKNMTRIYSAPGGIHFKGGGWGGQSN